MARFENVIEYDIKGLSQYAMGEGDKPTLTFGVEGLPKNIFVGGE